MRMGDPIPTFSYFAEELKKRHPDLAYLHVVEARGNNLMGEVEIKESETNDFLREIWAPNVLISAGGWSRETALAAVERPISSNELFAFGRFFLSNVRSCVPLWTNMLTVM